MVVYRVTVWKYTGANEQKILLKGITVYKPS